MIFYGLLVLLGVGIAAWAVRSSTVKQILRGHGKGRPPFSSANDHGFDHNGRTPRIDPLGRPRARDWE